MIGLTLPCNHQATKHVIVKIEIMLKVEIIILAKFKLIGKEIAAVERIAMVKIGKNNQTNKIDKRIAPITIGI